MGYSAPQVYREDSAHVTDGTSNTIMVGEITAWDKVCQNFDYAYDPRDFMGINNAIFPRGSVPWRTRNRPARPPWTTGTRI